MDAFAIVCVCTWSWKRKLFLRLLSLRPLLRCSVFVENLAAAKFAYISSRSLSLSVRGPDGSLLDLEVHQHGLNKTITLVRMLSPVNWLLLQRSTPKS